jgi:hypothetical protein
MEGARFHVKKALEIKEAEVKGLEERLAQARAAARSIRATYETLVPDANATATANAKQPKGTHKSSNKLEGSDGPTEKRGRKPKGAKALWSAARDVFLETRNHPMSATHLAFELERRGYKFPGDTPAGEVVRSALSRKGDIFNRHVGGLITLKDFTPKGAGRKAISKSEIWAMMVPRLSDPEKSLVKMLLAGPATDAQLLKELKLSDNRALGRMLMQITVYSKGLAMKSPIKRTKKQNAGAQLDTHGWNSYSYELLPGPEAAIRKALEGGSRD